MVTMMTTELSMMVSNHCQIFQTVQLLINQVGDHQKSGELLGME